MATCATFSEQLLDFLYGLLDEDETIRLRLHLQACPKCQAELREAEGHQRLISQAARTCKDVAPFTAPELDVPVSEPVVLPMTFPQPSPAPQTSHVPGKRFPRWLRYGSVALAASLLLGVVVAREVYRSGLNLREGQVAQVKKEIDGLDAKFFQASSKFAEEKKRIGQPSNVVQLNLTGTPQFDANAGGSFSVLANSLNSTVQTTPLDVQVIDAFSQKVLFEEEALCQGDNTKITVPTGLKSTAMKMVVTPRTVPASPPVVCDLRAAEPVYVTHLALNKTAFYARELLFFRTVTLEQFSLKPVAADIPLRFSLVNADGQVVKQLQGKTGPGGIAGGEIALTDDIPAGSYSLEAASLTGDTVRPQRRRLDILNANTLQVVMNQWKTDAKGNKSAYAAGDLAEGKLVGPDSSPIPEQRIIPNIDQPANQAVPLAAQRMPRTYSDNEGKFKVAVPDNLEASRAQLNLSIPTRTSLDSVKTTINVVPTKVIIDFYPEGGELIDGVRTKVYYRVRSLQRDPVIPDGRVIVKSKSGALLYESEPGQAVGFFTLTPNVNEHYEVRLSSTRTEVANAEPLEKLVRTHGLALSVPGVNPANEAIKARFLNKGEAKRLLVLATCRGQIVEQQTLQIKKGEGEVSVETRDLKPIGDVAGILRVTVYEIKQQTLVPLAERLVFRMPAHRLELAGSLAIQPGRNSLRATWNNEAKQPYSCYAYAAVVDSQFVGDNERDLPTHFYVDSDVSSPAELENASVIVHNNQDSWRALDLFLGTQGWRRFSAGPNPETEAADLNKLAAKDADTTKQESGVRGFGASAVVKEAAEPQQKLRAAAAGPALVSLQNASLTELQVKDHERVNQDQARLRKFFAVESAELARDREQLIIAHGRLAQTLADYQRLPQEILAAVLRVATLLGLAVGVVLMLVGFVRLARRQHAAMVFAGSFASLGACMVMMLSAGFGADKADPPVVAKLQVPAWPAPLPADDDRNRVPAPTTDTLEPGQYSLLAAAAAPVPKTDARGGMGGAGPADPSAAKKLESAALNEQMVTARVGNANYLQQNNAFGNSARFEDQARRSDLSQERESKDKGGPAAPQPVAPGGAGGFTRDGVTTKNKKLNDKELHYTERAREYALTLTNPQDRCDPMLAYPATVLWLPALEAKNGAVQLNFDLPDVPQARYRVIIEAHTDDGRLGSYMETLTPGAAPLQAK
jgi:hypothetical protein